MKRLLTLTVLLVTAALVSGCTASAQLSVLRPAILNARQYGGTMSVAGFDGDPQIGALTADELRQRIMNAEGQPVQLMAAGGALVIHGTVINASYDERIDRSQSSCSRSVTVNGQTTTVQVPCTQMTRTGTANVSITFNITHAQSGAMIYSQTMQDASTATRTATDAVPAGINGAAMVESLRAGLTEQFARIILPWRENVRVRLGRCGDAREFCDAGIVAVREGNFEAAIASFRQAVAFLQQSGADGRDTSEAHWNLGLAQEYSGDFAGAIQSIQQAIQLNPNNPSFAPELSNVQRMAEEAQRLAEQGVTAE